MHLPAAAGRPTLALVLASLLVRSSTSHPLPDAGTAPPGRTSRRHRRADAAQQLGLADAHLEHLEHPTQFAGPSARIVGGTPTLPHRHPYLASFQKVFVKQSMEEGTTRVFYAQKCGGTLIAERESFVVVGRICLCRNMNVGLLSALACMFIAGWTPTPLLMPCLIHTHIPAHSTPP